MDNDDDAAIVARVLGGDAESFRALVDRYSYRIYCFCRARLGDDEDAEDAVQDVFVRAFRSLRSFDPAKSWPSWLFSIAANRVKSRYAAKASYLALADRASIEASVTAEASSRASDPAEQVLDSLASEELRAAVATLPPSFRTPVELFYFGGLGVSGISEALGLGEEAIKTRLFRARKKLSTLLGDSPQPSSPKKGKH